MKKSLTTLFCGGLLSAVVAPAGFGQITNYSQDFEGLNAADPAALANDGWNFFATGFNPDNSVSFTFGPIGAANNSGAPNTSLISTLSSGGEPPAGQQGLLFLSDYFSPLHSDPNDLRDLELAIFQEQIITAADIGSTVTFSWLTDGNAAPPTGDAVAEAFLITLDPNAGFSRTNDLSFETTAIADGALSVNSLSLDLTDAALEGQILQFGFRNRSSDGEGSAVDYDNINFVVPEPASLALVGLGGLMMVSRRRQANR
ncbi:MAG: PEP-CTERM sorting domain-containing protein [Planctomycetota bacterium]